MSSIANDTHSAATTMAEDSADSSTSPSEIGKTPGEHHPIEPVQTSQDVPIREAEQQLGIHLELEHQDTPCTIHAPDGLPRVQGKHFIPKPIVFYVSVAIIVIDLFVMPVVYYYSFEYGTNLSLQDSE